jgi:glucuronate isomerase
MRLVEFTMEEVEAIFQKALNRLAVGPEETDTFRSWMFLHLAVSYCNRSWVQQYHLGALRNNNSRLIKTVGADAGCDSIGEYRNAEFLSSLLDRLDRDGNLSKTIIYNLNPSDNEVFATMCGNFNEGSVPGKMQWGSAWWFLDQEDGMKKQLGTLSNMGLLSHFIGMLTDSRSLLSFPRHEYFRRILCNTLGEDMRTGRLPNDMNWIGSLIRDVCYHNAHQYFNFGDQ